MGTAKRLGVVGGRGVDLPLWFGGARKGTAVRPTHCNRFATERAITDCNGPSWQVNASRRIPCKTAASRHAPTPGVMAPSGLLIPRLKVRVLHGPLNATLSGAAGRPAGK